MVNSLSLVDSPDNITGLPVTVTSPSPTGGSSVKARKPASKKFSVDCDKACLTILLCLVIAVFWQTIFQGGCISRLPYLADWDSLFDASRKGVSQHVDPSGILLGFPVYAHVSNLLHAGQMPLWNTLNACGAPLLADIQTTVLSPFHWLYYAFPTQYVLNLQLVMHVAIIGLGGYLLARALKVSPVASLLAATSLAFCPLFLWFLELPGGQVYALYPIVLAAFAYAAREKTITAALYAGVASGLAVLSGHPECSFFAVAGGSAFFLSQYLLETNGMPLSKRLLNGCGLLAFIGVSAFCIAAPVLIPFLEFLRNSDCYKFGHSGSAFVPAQGVIFNLLSPGFGGASPFLGALCVALLPFAFAKGNKAISIGLSAIAVLCVIFAAKIFPFGLLLDCPPFNYIITVYCLPLMLTCVAALASIGLQRVVARATMVSEPLSRTSVALSIGLVALIGLVPLICYLWHVPLASGNFDMTLPNMRVDKVAAIRDFVVVVIASVAAFVCIRRRSPLVCALLLAALNVGTLLPVAKNSLPVVASFDLPRMPVLDKLRASGERIVAVGAHVANPNINQFYEFADLRSRNALWPSRYLNFVQLLDGQVTDFDQKFSERLSPLIDIASVKYVLTTQPISCTSDVLPDLQQFTALSRGPQNVLSGLQLVYLSLFTDAENKQVNGYLQFYVEPEVLKRRFNALNMALVLEAVNESNGDVVWFSDRLPLSSDRIPLHIALPGDSKRWADERRLFLHVRLINTDTNTFVSLAETPEPGSSQPIRKTSKHAWQNESARLAAVPAGATCVHHFQLIDELPGNLRLYENKHSLPQAYIVENVVGANSGAEAIELMKGANFHPELSAVVEGGADNLQHRSRPAGSATAVELASSALNQPRLQAKVVASRPSANETSVKYESPAKGLLVLTDTFYPGWNAYLDGVKVPVLRANYLFRGVEVPAGAHTVDFRFEPLSFAVGVFLNLGFLSALVAWVIHRRMKLRNTLDSQGWQEGVKPRGGKRTRQVLSNQRKAK